MVSNIYLVFSFNTVIVLLKAIPVVVLCMGIVENIKKMYLYRKSKSLG